MTDWVTFYERAPVKCDTDELWEGRTLLRNAFTRCNGDSRQEKHSGTGNAVYVTMNEATPLHWFIDAPSIHRRAWFSNKTAEKVASPVVAFLKANGINVSTQMPARDAPWESSDLVIVHTMGSILDPHAVDPPTIVMLPQMHRRVWELVRNHDERPLV